MSQIPDSELIINPDGSIYHLNLKPQHLSEYIITVGDPGRVYTVSEHFDDVDFEMNKREFITHIGTYKGQRITVMSTGMGTDNIEIVLTELDALANIDFKKRTVRSRKKQLNIIRIGTSGAIQEDLRLGSHVATHYSIGFDNLMNFYQLEQNKAEMELSQNLRESLNLPFTPYCVKGSEFLLDKIGFDMIKGNSITAPGFYGPQGRKLRIEPKYPQLVNQLASFNYHNSWISNFEMESAGYYAMSRLMGHEVLSVSAIIANRAKGKFSKQPAKTIKSLILKVLNRITAE
jgi:uridine phosphorylase